MFEQANNPHYLKSNDKVSFNLFFNLLQKLNFLVFNANVLTISVI